MSALNPKTIDDLIEQIGDVGVVNEVIQAYLDSSPDRIKNIKDFLAKGDVLGASKESHALKSSSRSLGAEHLGKLCQDLEYLKNNPNVPDALRLFHEITAEYEAVIKELKIRLASST